MKKFLISLLLVLVCGTAFSQTVRYRANEYAFGERNYAGNITWGKWQSSNVIITIDFDNDFIKVYSQRNQSYAIIDTGKTYTDKSGGSNVDFAAIDEEGIRCTICLRVQKDGTAQMYTYYSDCAWVYSSLQRL